MLKIFKRLNLFKKNLNIITYKTEAWKCHNLAENHLKESGVRAEGLFLPTLERISIELAEKSKILDVGCGHGRLSISLAEKKFIVVASDVSDQMLSLLAANKKDLNIEIRKADAHKLSATDEEFDAVVSYDFMPHFPDWDVLLKEQARVVKKGGKIIFGFNFHEHAKFAKRFQNGSYVYHYTSSLLDNSKEYWGEMNQKTLNKVCKKNGLKIIKQIPIKFIHDNLLFGRALGNSNYNNFKKELLHKIREDKNVADFYEWLDLNLFQKMHCNFSYHNLVVLEKIKN